MAKIPGVHIIQRYTELNGVIFTRITGTPPTQLGEYRSYLRNASARTFTETNGAPAVAPSSTNGIVLYQGNSFTVADTNNHPTRYDIFVGINKNIKWEWNTSAGRTGGLDAGTIYDSSVTTNIGTVHTYDRATGIASVFVGTYQSNYTQHFIGLKTTDGDLFTGDGFFDIIIE